MRYALAVLVILCLAACIAPATPTVAPGPTQPAPPSATRAAPTATRVIKDQSPTPTVAAPKSTPVAATPSQVLPELIFFYADWCGYCRQMMPVIDGLAKEYDGRVKFTRLNVDDPANRSQTNKYSVRGVPHFFLVSQTGQLVTQWIGVTPAEQLRQGFARAGVQ